MCNGYCEERKSDLGIYVRIVIGNWSLVEDRENIFVMVFF